MDATGRLTGLVAAGRALTGVSQGDWPPKDCAGKLVSLRQAARRILSRAWLARQSGSRPLNSDKDSVAGRFGSLLSYHCPADRRRSLA